MKSPQFQRRIEDFVCEHCGVQVHGNGYTNHCPECLWSKHVDEQPGDRAAKCGGMMKPCMLEGSSPEYDLVHVCEMCGYTHRNRVVAGDNATAVLGVAKTREERNN